MIGRAPDRLNIWKGGAANSCRRLYLAQRASSVSIPSLRISRQRCMRSLRIPRRQRRDGRTPVCSTKTKIRSDSLSGRPPGPNTLHLSLFRCCCVHTSWRPAWLSQSHLSGSSLPEERHRLSNPFVKAAQHSIFRTLCHPCRYLIRLVDLSRFSETLTPEWSYCPRSGTKSTA